MRTRGLIILVVQILSFYFTHVVQSANNDNFEINPSSGDKLEQNFVETDINHSTIDKSDIPCDSSSLPLSVHDTQSSEHCKAESFDSGNHKLEKFKTVKTKTFAVLKQVKYELQRAFEEFNQLSGSPVAEEFCFRKYDIKGWPKGVPKLRMAWNKEQAIKILECMPNFEFVRLPGKISFRKEFGMDDSIDFPQDPTMSYKSTMEVLLKRFKTMTGILMPRINWDLVDRSLIPEKYKNVHIVSVSMESCWLYKNPEIVNNIRFYPLDHENANNNDNIRLRKYWLEKQDNLLSYFEDNRVDSTMEEVISNSEMSSSSTKRSRTENSGESTPKSKKPKYNQKLAHSLIRKEIQAAYEAYFISTGQSITGTAFSFRFCEIKGWPEGIPKIRMKWTEEQIDKIRENISKFEFVLLPGKINFDKEFGLDDPSIDFPTHHDWERGKILVLLLKRFRKESGKLNAKNINWKLVDRSSIPSQYSRIPIINYTMDLRKFYANPEIVENIHFYNDHHPQAKQNENIALIEYWLKKQADLFSFFENNDSVEIGGKINQNDCSEQANSNLKGTVNTSNEIGLDDYLTFLDFEPNDLNFEDDNLQLMTPSEESEDNLNFEDDNLQLMTPSGESEDIF